MAHVVGATVKGYFECSVTSLNGLIDMAKRVDDMVGADPPKSGYGLAEAISAIFNGGTQENIQTALQVLAGWNFQPEGGWPS